MRYIETALRCYECREKFNCEEVETVTRDGKVYAVCPYCEFEVEIHHRHKWAPIGAMRTRKQK